MFFFSHFNFDLLIFIPWIVEILALIPFFRESPLPYPPKTPWKSHPFNPSFRYNSRFRQFCLLIGKYYYCLCFPGTRGVAVIGNARITETTEVEVVEKDTAHHVNMTSLLQ